MTEPFSFSKALRGEPQPEWDLWAAANSAAREVGDRVRCGECRADNPLLHKLDCSRRDIVWERYTPEGWFIPDPDPTP